MNTESAQQYWERKILPWERSRYSQWLALYPPSWSLRARMRAALKTIHDRAPVTCSILELGCGSGLLAAQLWPDYPKYFGIDIAQNAVQTARERVPAYRFESRDVLAGELEPCDLTVFLGLTDWLNNSQLETLFGKLRSEHLLFSFTSPASWSPYRAYRLAVDGPAPLRARAYGADEIRALLARHGYNFELLASPTLMNPGALVWSRKIRC